MTDVLELARERRRRLAAEIKKLDEFIQMAEMLVKYNPEKTGRLAQRDDEEGDPGRRPTVVPPYPSRAGGDNKG